ncbi:MAG TPA: dipeptidase PepE [Candidatus Rikenella faecigallinarum]|uniref:dipeptidase E n=1 Tax=Candidatus Rikenella faecigallinarum TaxID=2838745 RepID=A0A9D1TXW6_9BACT|nr:dipeptidase PepE [Candidatus Rikenella faecigallinarum]
MRLLLISNSTNAGEAYLEYPKQQIADFLAASSRPVDTVLFVPYAAVTFSYDDYQAKVAARFAEFGVKVDSVHRYANPAEAVRKAQAIVVGGGNTFHLAKSMQDAGLYEPIREAVRERGVPYIGWSAGSNMSCPTLCTTNDMPIVEPLSFKALNLIPFQINPHYLDAHPDGHAGETREMRIEEYIAANQGMYVAGLREGCMLLVEESKMTLIGKRSLRLFHYGAAPRELTADDDLSFLL